MTVNRIKGMGRGILRRIASVQTSPQVVVSGTEILKRGSITEQQRQTALDCITKMKELVGTVRFHAADDSGCEELVRKMPQDLWSDKGDVKSVLINHLFLTHNGAMAFKFRYPEKWAEFVAILRQAFGEEGLKVLHKNPRDGFDRIEQMFRGLKI